MRVLLTGAQGFLGWHTHARIHALSGHQVVPVGRTDWHRLGELAADCDAVIHVAGINRGEPDEVEKGNVKLAEDLAVVMRRSPFSRMIYADSIQAGSDTPYGRGKSRAGQILAAASEDVGADFSDLRLPNLFGEGCRPNYNSFVATFVQHVLNDSSPQIVDRPIDLLHVQDAAAVLIDALESPSPPAVPSGTSTTVQSVFDTLASMYALYQRGDIPALATDFDLQLFNTLRYAMFPAFYPIRLPRYADHRGALTEAVKVHGGQGQSFVSTTVPGVTRGEHFHLHKVERFVVVSGRARIELRKVLSSDAVTFDVDGDNPAVIDMPTLWAHNITNTGDTEVVTLFWANEIFDPAAPDTYAEPVRKVEEVPE
ncbi:NAD-dependent epimerase/dehydratase family protein [Microlunatus sp. Gsoil 973]|uniref:polysaccharide biosynthesis C-terminal domain-containing protein n=1 Tax=Microlunatus sp. Gsoil 973 TaxID=2672569 RepID=UPI0012B47DD7|nr:NAD-dependent epimerase/dehydratase family protein [Microlunatus sp. Gsoil 973]QGN32791.1 NAD-dependent epimerase/dehydratase family protein [Microlunatus sp. Gsoil 973]